MSFWNNFAKVFCSKSNGCVVQTCMLSIQFAFVVIGHDLY